MALLNRTPKNAAVGIASAYVVFLLLPLVISGRITGGGAVLSLIPAILVGMVSSGYLMVISGPGGIRLVDPARTPAQIAAAQQSLARPLDNQPLINVDGTPMCGSVDLNGNPYGVSKVE